jgi:hypothetical protein
LEQGFLFRAAHKTDRDHFDAKDGARILTHSKDPERYAAADTRRLWRNIRSSKQRPLAVMGKSPFVEAVSTFCPVIAPHERQQG